MTQRGRWVFDREIGGLVASDEFYARRSKRVSVSDLPFPMVVSDQIELQSQVDGKIYTSKSALRRSYRERGYIEVGNEDLKPAAKQKPDRKAIRDSLGRAFIRSGFSL